MSNDGQNPSNGSSNQFEREQRTSIQKLEALILKIGMFSLGYAIPASVVLACYYYETKNYDSWVNSWLIRKAEDNSDTIPYYCELQDSVLKEDLQKPLLSIFLIKYLVQLILGIICGLFFGVDHVMFRDN